MKRFVAAWAVVSLSFASGDRALASAPPAAADFVLDLDAGLACEFPLRLEIWVSSQHRPYREFFDRDGNFVRVLSAGVGNRLALTNLDSGASLTTRANGANETITPNPDGTETHVLTGHNLLILFPSDVPAGPTTTLYVGQVVFDVDLASGVFTLRDASGTATDVCAALE